MKFLVIDDHAVVREGLSALLHQFDQDATVLQAASAEEGLAAIAAAPDLNALFLDLRMPAQNGLDVITALCQRAPQVPIIVLSVSEDADDVRRAFQAGALGYVPKSANSQTMLSALQLVLSGETYVPPFVLNATPTEWVPPRATTNTLTERQTEVLRHLCRGLSNKEISRALDVSEKTTKAHITAIFKTLGVVNRAQAMDAARQIIPADGD